MNVTFRIGRAEGDPALEEAFIAESKEAHMLGLKGHRCDHCLCQIVEFI